MKILISAIACHPQGSSESFVGWQAVAALRADHQLWVITDPGAREAIEALQQSDPSWQKVSFHYVGTCRNFHANRLIARLQSWQLYRHWCREAHNEAKRLCNEVAFDVAHHVTYATWRMGSPLAGLGVPLLWGPIGGGESFPLHLMGQLSPTAIGFELVRKISTALGLMAESPRQAARCSAFVLPNNNETKSLVRRLGAPDERIEILAQSFLSATDLARFAPKQKPDPREHGCLEIVGGGNLEGRKGVSIALRALALAKIKGVKFRYRFFGKGPELTHLQSLIVKLGLEKEVFFCDSLQGDDFVAMLQGAHLYLLPSLREGVPVTQLEAMAAGCVPIVSACGGAGPMAESAGARTIQVGSSSTMIREIVMILQYLWEQPTEWQKQSKEAVAAIEQNYSADHYAQKMNLLYERAAVRRLQ